MSVGLQVWSQTAGSNSTSDTNINWPEGMAPSQVNDSARAMMASMAKWRDDNSGTGVTSGSSTAFTFASAQVSTGNTNGYTVAVRFHATADSSASLNVDAQGAAKIQLVSGTNLLGQEIQAGEIWNLTYSSTATAWILNGSGYTQTNDLVAGAVTYAKIQNESATTLLGNPTGGSAAPSEITLGTNLSFSGTVLNAGNNTPVVTVITSTATATWQSTTQGGNFPLYLHVRMVGGGGGGGATITNNGTSGSSTSFSNWGALGGGAGAAASGAPGSGGSGGSNGTGTLITRIGGAGGTQSNSAAASVAGVGGNSFYGGAGPTATSTGFAAAANSGSGGGGGAQSAGNGGSGGGAGEYVEFIVTSPSTSYTVQVGPGGAGGAAGTNAGGAGAAGRIEVIAYWQ